MRRSLVRAGVVAVNLWSRSFTRFVALIAAALVVLASCSALAQIGRDTGHERLAAKYEQTWSRSYSDTTCSEFTEVMSPQQRFAASADMLTAARSVDGANSMPADSLVGLFVSGLDRSCVDASQPLADAGAILYRVERFRFRP